MYVVYLAEDLHPHPRAYVGYFLRYSTIIEPTSWIRFGVV